MSSSVIACTMPADVGRGAGNRTRRGQATEKRTNDIGQTLRDELGIRVVLIIHKTVGHDGGEQRFDRAKQCDGGGRRDEVTHAGN
jgi:hypothetical protein